MKARALLLVPALAAAPQLAGCQSAESTTGLSGIGGGPGTPVGGSNTGGASDGAGGAGAGGASGRACGGPAGLPCPAEEYCAFVGGAQCGDSDASGVCRPRPEACAQHCEGACGCDGQLYCNPCMAHAAGADATDQMRICLRIRTCEDVAEAIARAADGNACTAVVRLDYLTRAIKSVRLVCAQAAIVTATGARKVAERATGFGAGAQLVSGLAPADEYVFWEPPSDSGGVAAVSARNGQPVFGGSIVWDGEGTVVYPVAFNHPATSGPTCGSSAAQPPARGIDLTTIDELPAAEVDAALDAVWTSALPDGLARRATLQDAMVLLYPPQVGAFEPSSAEWVVMLNSGAGS